MLARLIFLGLAAFWVTMNVLLWRMEYGARGGDTPVPPLLVWHKILTAPDASSLSVYQKGERMGYCEVASGVGQQMAAFDEGRLAAEGFTPRTGYLLHLAGNVSLGDFTNRFKFEGRIRFDRLRQWEELSLRIISHSTAFEIHSLATNQTAHIKFSNEGTPVLERDVAFSDLQNPSAIFRAFAGTLAGDFLGFDAADVLPDASGQMIIWEARRTRVKIGTEFVPVYRVETSFLGHPITADISTLGEILNVDLPDSITARIDEWSKP
jgi:hypothetical protein